MSDHPEALAERARIARLLSYWAPLVGDVWTGVDPGHAPLLAHLSTVFAPPEEQHVESLRRP